MIDIRINEEFCKGCILCVSVCRKGVLSMSEAVNSKGNNYAVAEPEKCIGCKMCATMCPEGAIELYKE